MNESSFQAKLIKKLNKRLDGCVIIKNDSGYIQGICDLTILYKDKWAMLEVKKSPDASIQPNQKYYIDKFKKLGYAAFINPENEEVILNELEQSLRS